MLTLAALCSVIHGDILLQDGLIKVVGKIPTKLIRDAGANLVRLDAGGAWVTPGKVKLGIMESLFSDHRLYTGIFDIHSHIGVDGVPALRGASLFGHFHSFSI